MRKALLVSTLLQGAAVAQAGPLESLPEISSGSIPFVHYGGSMEPLTTVDLVTVPEGQDLIITLVNSSPGARLLADGAVAAPYWLTEAGANSSVSKGTASLRFTSGTTVSLYNLRDSDTGYFVQGYLAAPNSPYRSFAGFRVDSPSVRHIFTAESDRAFLVQTTAVLGGCDVLIDDVLTIPATSKAAYVGYTNRGMIQGRATLVIPPGATLQIQPSECDYYFDGKYLVP
jgi:hypothetical protein